MSIDYHRSKSRLGHTKPFSIDSLDILQWTVELLDVSGENTLVVNGTLSAPSSYII